MAAFQNYNSHTHHGEDGHGAPVFDFTEQSIRKGFIRKVYAILMSQLLVTIGVIAFFMFHEPMKEFVAQKMLIILGAAAIVGFVCLLVMACCTEVRRTAPMNFIFLAIFTIAESLLLGVVTCLLQASEVMIAVGITASVCLGLTIFAFQTKWDFTMVGGALVAAFVVLLDFGILAMIFQDKMTNLGYTAAGTLVFSLYLVYDTQLMIGGKHKYSVSPEEYIFAALNLYLDILIIFLYILRHIASR